MDALFVFVRSFLLHAYIIKERMTLEKGRLSLRTLYTDISVVLFFYFLNYYSSRISLTRQALPLASNLNVLRVYKVQRITFKKQLTTAEGTRLCGFISFFLPFVRFSLCFSSLLSHFHSFVVITFTFLFV